MIKYLITLLILMIFLISSQSFAKTNDQESQNSLPLEQIITLYREFKSVKFSDKKDIFKRLENKSISLLSNEPSLYSKIQIYIILIKSYEEIKLFKKRDQILSKILNIENLPSKVSHWINLKQLEWSLKNNGDISKFFQLAINSISNISKDHLKIIFPDFLLVTKELFDRRFFQEATLLSKKLLKKTCRFKWSNTNILYKNSILLQIINNRLDDAIITDESTKKCHISKYYRKKALSQIFKNFSLLKDRSLGDRLLAEISNINLFFPYYIKALSILPQNTHILKKIEKYYDKWKKYNVDFPLEDLDIVATIKNDILEKKISLLKQEKLAFPEGTFNQILEKKFKNLDEITQMAFQIINIGSGDGIVKSFSLLTNYYHYLIKEFHDFIPPHSNKKYLKNFKFSMKQIARPIHQKYIGIIQQTKDVIKTKEIFSKYNDFFLRGPLPIKMKIIKQSKLLVDRIQI